MAKLCRWDLRIHGYWDQYTQIRLKIKQDEHIRAYLLGLVPKVDSHNQQLL